VNNLETFWYWINERHAIYLNREEGQEAPWTEDKILQSYRFCNVYRELDVVTEWIRDNWRTPWADHPNLWFAMCVARQINRPETLKKFGFPRDNLREYVVKIRGIMQKMRDRGEQIYGAAYILTAGGKAMQKHLYTADYVLMPIAKDPPSFAKTKSGWSLQGMWKGLREYEGFGPFIAYEVVTDLRHTRYYNPHGPQADHMKWANAGPGAKRGLARIYYNDKEKRLSEKECLLKMRELLAMSAKDGILHPALPKLEMRDIEHSLCETDKYLRAKSGLGRPKAKYPGEGT